MKQSSFKNFLKNHVTCTLAEGVYILKKLVFDHPLLITDVIIGFEKFEYR